MKIIKIFIVKRNEFIFFFFLEIKYLKSQKKVKINVAIFICNICILNIYIICL